MPKQEEKLSIERIVLTDGPCGQCRGTGMEPVYAGGMLIGETPCTGCGGSGRAGDLFDSEGAEVPQRTILDNSRLLNHRKSREAVHAAST